MIGFGERSKAQTGLCPSNLDFEQNNFTGWDCWTWSVPNPTPVYGPVFNRHTIIDAATAGTDPFGFFPTLCPNGSGHSLRLGNFNTGSERESISYTYTIPLTASNFSMLFYYAVVLEDPASHPLPNQPRFQARIIDVVTGLPIPCVDFDFISSTAPGGFRVSPIPGHLGSPVLYKDWTSVSINLDAYIGRTIKLEFVTYDCAQSGHAGYAYLDVYTACNGAILGNTICQGDTTITLTAPYGYQTYTWYSDLTFTSVLSNVIDLILTPPPPIGSVFPVVVGPFPGYGCDDTLYATITSAPNPVSVAGPDITICEGQQVQIGGPPTSGYNYLWTPPGQVSDPLISDPMAWNTGPPTEFIVKTTDLLTGCFSTDSIIITSSFVDTTLLVTGKSTYCTGDPAAGLLSVNNTVVSVQWYDGGTPIPGATGLSYQPLVSGNYWAQVQQMGCTDSTRTISFTINTTPVSVAGPDLNICANQPTQIGAPPNPAYNYSWTPANLTNDPLIADPFAWVVDATPVEFIVHTTDPLSGCNSYDTVILSGRVVDTALFVNGKNDYCMGDPAAGTLTVNNSGSAVQWYDGSTLIPGATGFTYQPTVTGNYWAELQQFGCTDSTAIVAFTIHALPVAFFTASSDSGCVTNNTFLFKNGSTVSDGAALSYLWKFSDGTTQTVTDATKTFLTSGNKTAQLITTTVNGCKDSMTYTVIIMPNGVPDFKWDSICINRPIYFTNLSNEKGSVLVNYNWDFGPGIPGSVLKNPPPVIFTTPGKVDVTLKLVAFGCESDTQVVIKNVQVNKQANGFRYPTITVPENSTRFIHVRDTVGPMYNWRPPIQLSSYSTAYTEFTAINDVNYLIDITDIHTCLTTDSMQILVLKKPGFYLPTAFTPNNDGLNDIIRPYLVGMKGLKSFSVFNRWGNLIFFSKTYGEGWDGKSRGVEQNAGTYVWILEFYDANNKLVREKGYLTLIR